MIFQVRLSPEAVSVILSLSAFLPPEVSVQFPESCSCLSASNSPEKLQPCCCLVFPRFFRQISACWICFGFPPIITGLNQRVPSNSITSEKTRFEVKMFFTSNLGAKRICSSHLADLTVPIPSCNRDFIADAAFYTLAFLNPGRGAGTKCCMFDSSVRYLKNRTLDNSTVSINNINRHFQS